MDPLRTEILIQRLRERLAATGQSPREASCRAGLGLSYVNDILAGVSRGIGQQRLVALAGVLDCDPGWLIGNDRLGDPEGEATALHVARAIQGECRDFAHAVKVARMALAASKGTPE